MAPSSPLRKIVDITKSACTLAWPVIKVAIITTVILGIIFVPVQAQMPRGLQCTERGCQAAPLTFPTYTASFMNNGLQLVPSGEAACQINTRLFHQIHCERQAQQLIAQHSQTDELAKWKSTPAAYYEKGRVIRGGGDYKAVHLAMNPQRMRNYEKALEYVTANLLHDDAPFQGTSRETIKQLQKIHELLTKDLPNVAEILPGQFRKGWTVVHGDQIGLEKEIRLAASPREKALIDHFRQRMFETKELYTPTQEELGVLRKFYYVPPDPKLVHQEMKTFSVALKEKIQEHGNPLELASWVHNEIIRIHPFKDANGRLARLILHIILKKFADIDPLIFPDDAAYNEAVGKSLKEPHIFAKFLQDTIIPWNQAQVPNLYARLKLRA